MMKPTTGIRLMMNDSHELIAPAAQKATNSTNKAKSRGANNGNFDPFLLVGQFVEISPRETSTAPTIMRKMVPMPTRDAQNRNACNTDVIRTVNSDQSSETTVLIAAQHDASVRVGREGS